MKRTRYLSLIGMEENFRGREGSGGERGKTITDVNNDSFHLRFFLLDFFSLRNSRTFVMIELSLGGKLYIF